MHAGYLDFPGNWVGTQCKSFQQWVRHLDFHFLACVTN